MEKVALITGAAGGLGRSVADRLDQAGWQLVLVSRDGDRLARAYGSQHLQVVADCSSVVGARHIIDVAKAHRLLPTTLAHCVGNIRLGALHRMSEVDFKRLPERQPDQRLPHPGGLCRCLARCPLRRRGGARLVRRRAHRHAQPRGHSGRQGWRRRAGARCRRELCSGWHPGQRRGSRNHGNAGRGGPPGDRQRPRSGGSPVSPARHWFPPTNWLN
jgi:NAD(P)-dependent dehydrogenase (short-subunit alcohol dehydrogenase family)